MAGDFTVSRLRAVPIPQTGDKWHAAWRCDDAGSSTPYYLCFLNRKLRRITTLPAFTFQADPDDDAILEVIATTAANSSAVWESSTTRLGTGNKAHLEWSSARLLPHTLRARR